MAEEFQAADVCGGTWWTSPRAPFNGSPFIGNVYGGCWQNDLAMNMKTRSTDESSGSCVTAISPDSTFQTPTTSTTTWNQALLVNGTTEDQGYNQTLTEILNNIPAGSENTSSFGMNQEQTSSFITTSYGYPSSLLQNLFDCSSPPPVPPPQQPLYDFQGNLDNIDRVSSMPRGLHLANKTPFWNASAVDLNDNRTGFFASSRPRFVSSTFEERPNCPNIKSQNKEIQDMGLSLKKGSGEPTFKRARVKTPSPLPTFKVRKEKLGDRVTALQQLVSPFGKTDTASVLHEAIEYIKLLHDQVNVLSTPYMKNGATMQLQQMNAKLKDNHEGVKQQDLKSRGLCLVPVSSTFPVASDAAPEYWTSSFGSTFK
ncbi:transcription factor bHLH112-like [Bidens hawaiensis]|uniref:transcription factor bHLH112-like n=1 Tax=Bidens hawaiensis TaxID=980011 RepID=UPI004049732B